MQMQRQQTIQLLQKKRRTQRVQHQSHAAEAIAVHAAQEEAAAKEVKERHRADVKQSFSFFLFFQKAINNGFFW
jgi:hypothetical protein